MATVKKFVPEPQPITYNIEGLTQAEWEAVYWAVRDHSYSYLQPDDCKRLGDAAAALLQDLCENVQLVTP